MLRKTKARERLWWVSMLVKFWPNRESDQSDNGDRVVTNISRDNKVESRQWIKNAVYGVLLLSSAKWVCLEAYSFQKDWLWCYLISALVFFSVSTCECVIFRVTLSLSVNYLWEYLIPVAHFMIDPLSNFFLWSVANWKSDIKIIFFSFVFIDPPDVGTKVPKTKKTETWVML